MLFSIFLIASIVVASHAAPNGRIVGGVISDIKDFPYQVSIQYRSNHHCGGAIISNKWILSAAHCFPSIKPKDIKVRIGSSFHRKDGKIIDVVKIINHHYYSKSTNKYDFALLELAEPLEFNESVQSISLPAKGEETPVGTKCVVSGWGSTQSLIQSNKQLRSVVVPIVDHDDCVWAYQNFNKITDDMICAGYTDGGKDACQGDSGGPLVHNNKLVGVVSFGIGCADGDYPGVYGNVAYVRDWIKEVSKV
ncbi:trypsin-2-like [Culicoides brevitarsis]|uniref:trypsin-2-like n=1 Tax=Culicoides brevitarsis TaxID=469753 RepID=UPI00307C8AD3